VRPCVYNKLPSASAAPAGQCFTLFMSFFVWPAAFARRRPIWFKLYVTAILTGDTSHTTQASFFY